MATDHNAKRPKNPWVDISLKYPWLHGERYHDGSFSFRYKNPTTPEDSSYINFEIDGSYESFQRHGEKSAIKTTFNSGEERNYTAGGSSNHTDGHRDVSTEGTSRSTTTGDVSNQSGRNTYNASAGKIVDLSTTKISAVATASKPITYDTSGGDVVKEHSGDYHTSYEGDHVSSVSENRVVLIKNGDEMKLVKSGNQDTQVNGKSRLKSGNDILIESDTKITFKVGSSTIVIDGSSITINADRIDLN